MTSRQRARRRAGRSRLPKRTESDASAILEAMSAREARDEWLSSARSVIASRAGSGGIVYAPSSANGPRRLR